MRSDSFDLAVIGAGISGLSVAYAAVQQGLSAIVIDYSQPGSGASGVPLALLNPATGRRAKKVPSVDESLPCTKALLTKIEHHSETSFYSANGVVRPALDEKMASKMAETIRTTKWPPNWIHWLDRNELVHRFKGLQCHTGGLWIPAGATVDMPRFLKALAEFLQTAGVHVTIDPAYRISDSGRITLSKKAASFTAKEIVYATGSGLADDPLWRTLPLHPIKGQTLRIRLKAPLPFTCSVSALGYIAQFGGTDEIVLGSTYEHQFDHLNPDEAGETYLLNRLERVLPELRKQVIHKSGWAGVRTTTPDRKPVIGSHPEQKHRYVIGGLGSKGLIQAPWLASRLITHITQAVELPKMFDANRFYR